MFRKRDPQGSLFQSSLLLPPAKAQRLQDSWAEVFRTRALPLIREELFAPLYCPDNGRPNRPVQTVFGVLLLKDLFDLTDQQALEQLEFSLLWHHALALTPEEAHLPQKTLHNFRAGLMERQLERQAFAEITDRILAELGTQVGRQRLDSTHVISNIAVLTRLGLFCETMRVFLAELKANHPRLWERVAPRLRERYLKEDGQASGYQDAPSPEGRRRLAVCARDAYRLRELFGGTTAATGSGYGLLDRLVQEQCTVVRRRQRPSRDDDDHGQGGVPVVLKEPKEVDGTSLQSPHDPDVTYSGHKGKGYSVQVMETCDADNAVEIITQVEVTDACASDGAATLGLLAALAERGQQPQELVADTAYGSADNALEAQRQGTELVSPASGSGTAVPETAGLAPTAADFAVDVRGEDPAICPAGHLALDQTHDRQRPQRVTLRFERRACESCRLRGRCPVQLDVAQDAYVLRLDLVATNLEQRRRAEASGTFSERYAIRAGSEATNSELKRRHGLGHLRVRGRARVVLAVHLKALACNLKRMVWALQAPVCPALPTTA
jgi:hypothetical protein